jgi:tRNA(His) 5'-end guanylyltransferase
MKAQYESRARFYLPRRTYTLVRVDGKTFHSYTRGLERPFDSGLMADMDGTARTLCENVSGCAFAYVQSDEISLLLTDFGAASTEAWFDGNVQKIASITASLATAAFNRARLERRIREAEYLRPGRGLEPEDLLAAPEANFDARVFTIPDPVEVENYFLWRQQDATRNSIFMAAQAVYSHAELLGKSTDRMQEMLWQKGSNWNDYPDGCKRGRVVVKKARQGIVEYTHRRTGAVQTAEVERMVWEVEAPPVFTRERTYLSALIPRYS